MSVYLKRVSASLYPPRIVCFVCANEGPADYPLYAEPPAHANPTTAPHFPFLAAHAPPVGCHPVTETGGEAKACRHCYTTLMRQWEEYERARIPLVRRAYWIKRADEVPFLTPEQQHATTLALHSRRHPSPSAPAPAIVPAAAVPPASLMVAPMPPATTAAVNAPVTLVETLAPPPPTVGKVPSGASVPLAHHHGWSGRDRESSRRAPARPAASSASEDHSSSVPAAAVVPVAATNLTSSGRETGVSANDNDSALDLSSGSRERETMKSRSSAASHISAVSHHSSYQSEGAGSSTDILDLTLPDKNAAFEVCYVCGDEFRRGTLSHTFAKQMNREPFYPSLMCHSRPPKSQPMDPSGRVQTCDECHNHLLQQWHQFEQDEVPHTDRNYVLRKRAAQSAADAANTTFVCYICALDYHSSSLRLLYARPNTEQELYYPFIEQQKPPPGASPISPQGMVQVCTLCYKSTKEKHHGFLKADQPPPKKRRIEAAEFAAAAAAGEEEEKGLPADVTCVLCRRRFSVGSFKFLHSRGPPAGGIPFFPFLTDLPKPEELVDVEGEDKQGRVRACQSCATSLMNQWTSFQREGTTLEERHYNYPSLSTGPRSVSSVRAQSPASQRSAGAATPVKTSSAAASLAAAAIAASAEMALNAPRTRSNTVESRPRSASNPHSPVPHHAAAAAVAAAAAAAASLATPVSINHPPPIASPATTATSAGGSRATSAVVLPPSNTPSVVTNPNPPAACQSPSASVHSVASAPAAAAAAASSALGNDGSNSNAVPSSVAPPPITTATAPPPSSAVSKSVAGGNSTSSSSFYCFLCGLHSELSFSRMLYSTPQGKKAPYFPFMRSHVPKNKAETLREDGTALVCTFCYHSVKGQWDKYNELRGAQAVDPASRKYNINEYACYVCGITTYRKRIRALRVLDFPFIRQHKVKKGVIMLENGEMVAVCLDCYERLRGQYNDGERYGIPVEQRQYNWMKIPPPPEESSAHITTPQERLLKVDSGAKAAKVAGPVNSSAASAAAAAAAASNSNNAS